MCCEPVPIFKTYTWPGTGLLRLRGVSSDRSLVRCDLRSYGSGQVVSVGKRRKKYHQKIPQSKGKFHVAEANSENSAAERVKGNGAEVLGHRLFAIYAFRKILYPSELNRNLLTRERFFMPACRQADNPPWLG